MSKETFCFNTKINVSPENVFDFQRAISIQSLSPNLGEWMT